MADGTLRIIPLGGLGEVGKNMTVYEYRDDIVVVDAGLAFPRDEQLGVDLVLPDFGYLSENSDRVLAVLLTHGHEDHVGGLPYLLRRVPIRHIWGTKLTLALVQSKLDEHGLLRAAELHEADPEGDPVEIGPFQQSLARRHIMLGRRPADKTCSIPANKQNMITPMLLVNTMSTAASLSLAVLSLANTQREHNDLVAAQAETRHDGLDQRDDISHRDISHHFLCTSQFHSSAWQR